MNNVISKVALVRCFSYQQEEVEQALAKGLALLGGFSNIFSAKPPAAESVDAAKPLALDSRLILKPNLLAKTDPDKACTTHPAVFHAVGKALQEAGYTNLKYGDSPGNPMIRVEKVAEECGIKQAADDLGIPWEISNMGRRWDLQGELRIISSFAMKFWRPMASSTFAR